MNSRGYQYGQPDTMFRRSAGTTEVVPSPKLAALPAYCSKFRQWRPSRSSKSSASFGPQAPDA
jgi:hypothetical protein